MPSLDSFHDSLRTMLEATSYELALADHEMGALAEMYGIQVERKSTEELRAEFNQSIAGLLLGGSITWWTARKDVARVLVKRDGTTVIFARSHPRLTKAEVGYLREELCFCGFPQVKLVAIWKD